MGKQHTRQTSAKLPGRTEFSFFRCTINAGVKERVQINTDCTFQFVVFSSLRQYGIQIDWEGQRWKAGE